MNQFESTRLGADAALRLLACLFLIAVVIGFFIPEWGKVHGRVASYTHDLAHVPLFAAIAASLLFLWPRRHNTMAKAGMALGAALGVVLVVELIQPLVGRTAAMTDILLGAVGCSSVVATYLGLCSQSQRRRRIFFTVAGALLVAALIPMLVLLADRLHAARAFPVLDSFERPVELGRWVPEGCVISRGRDHATRGRYALRVEVTDTAANYPSVFLNDGVLDLRGYQYLSFDVYLDGEQSRVLWVRADDRDNPPYMDRAQVPIEIKPGSNRICIDLPTFSKTPNGRSLDMGRLLTLGLFLERASPGDTYYLDNMALSGPVSAQQTL